MSKTENLYILGHPISHSKSPVMYNAAYKAFDIPWTYDFMDLDTVDEAIAFLNDANFFSINITTPYKPQAYEAAKLKAATAQLARGVNLLVNLDGTLMGYNVDGTGCISFLEREGVKINGAKVVVCGTGPTALAILFAANQAGAKEVLLLGRDKDKTQRIINQSLDTYEHLASTAIDLPASTDGHLSFVEAYELGNFKFGSYDSAKKAIAGADVIIDATPLGMHEGDPAPFDVSLLHKDQVVLDSVYGHGISNLVEAATNKGLRAFNGKGMLISQAVASFTIVTEIAGLDLDASSDEIFDIMERAFDQ